MAESTADVTATNADSLRLELKKIVTEILDDGGVSEDRDGGVSEDRGGGVSEDRGGGVSEDRGGGVSKDRGGGVSEDRDGGVSEDRGGGVSEDRGGGVSEDRDGGVSEDRDGGVSEDPGESDGSFGAFIESSPAEMAESTADVTATNADSLRLELKKTVMEILDDGGVSEDRDGGVSEDRGESDGSFGALKAIDKAVKILNLLREVASKRAESDILSPYSPGSIPKVPKEFICPLSYAIMSEPVVTASGQTYEKRYIQEWLKHKHSCPKTKEVVSHHWLVPNNLIDELIAQWCQVNKYDRPKPSYETDIGLFSDEIDSLLHQICTPNTVTDQIQSANSLRLQTKRFANVRAFFVAEIPDSITRLLSPLSALGDAVDSNPDLQQHIIAALSYISIVEENKTAVAQNPLVIPILTKSLKQGTAKTRKNSSEALLLLSAIDSNKIIIGNSETLKALIDLIKDDDFTTALNAACTVCHLCTLLENRERAISEGLITMLVDKFKAGSKVDLCLATLSSMTAYGHSGVIEEMEDLGFTDDLFSVLRNPSCSQTGENAVAIVLRMCGLNTGDRNRDKTRLKVLDEEENKYGTFSKLAKHGSAIAATKAKAILQWLKRAGTGEEPQRG